MTHDGGRLTDRDKNRMLVAMLDAVDPAARVHVTDPDRLRRIGAHAIGLPIRNLREAEVEWIDATVRMALMMTRVRRGVAEVEEEA